MLQITELITVSSIQYALYWQKKGLLSSVIKTQSVILIKTTSIQAFFPKELGRKIVTAEEIRHASDYDTFYIASKQITSQQIQTAEQLLVLATDYLEK